MTGLPKEFGLEQNYPNPFNPTRIIQYAFPANVQVLLDVFDVLGRRVAELVSGQVAAGYYEVEFNATNLATGIYFYRINSNGEDGKNFMQIRKLMLVNRVVTFRLGII